MRVFPSPKPDRQHSQEQSDEGTAVALNNSPCFLFCANWIDHSQVNDDATCMGGQLLDQGQRPALPGHVFP